MTLQHTHTLKKWDLMSKWALTSRSIEVITMLWKKTNNCNLEATMSWTQKHNYFMCHLVRVDDDETSFIEDRSPKQKKRIEVLYDRTLYIVQ